MSGRSSACRSAASSGRRATSSRCRNRRSRSRPRSPSAPAAAAAHVPRFCIRTVSVISSSSTWIEPEACQRRLHGLDQVGALDVTARDIDRHRIGGMPSSDHATICLQTSRIAHSVIGMIRPVSSATAMNSPGGTSTPPRFQRISASAPTIVPVDHVDLRLVVQHQFVALERLVQRGLQPPASAVAVFIADEKRIAPLRPLSLTAYIAMSELRSRWRRRRRRAGRWRCPSTP